MAGTVIRAPNHLGDLVMALPALALGAPDVVVVRRWLLPLLEITRLRATLIPLDRGWNGGLAVAHALRQRGLERGILLPPSLSSALIFRAARLPVRRGTRTDSRGLLLTDPVPADAARGQHRASLYVELVTGRKPAEPPVPALLPTAGGWQQFGACYDGPPRPIGIFPGSNASSRRWSAERFRELARRLVEAGHPVVIFGGPEDAALTATVAVEGATDCGGKTDLPGLAAGLSACRIVITNDSGPMHLAAAVGTRVLAILGAGDPHETGPLGGNHVILRYDSLPCVPCRKNVCPRHGRGNFLPRAERECMELIEVDDVERAFNLMDT